MEATMRQERLEELLKKKGIGPEGSKSLNEEELKEISILLKEAEVSAVTKATILTAILTLEKNPAEETWSNEIISNPRSHLPEELIPFIDNKTSNPFYSLVNKVISNNNLSEEESAQAMELFFNSEQPGFLKAAFLEAERLKRETFIENKTFFNALFNKIPHLSFSKKVLIDICDNYDGCNRTRNFSVFIAALLASVGIPTYLHGIEKVAPKQGVTSHQILKAASKNPLMTAKEVLADLENPEIGWGYIDQSVFFPELFDLRMVRKEMVKRPFLATFEKLLQPISAKGGNFLVTGYTHPHYRTEVVNQIKEQGKCPKAIVLKGAEGSTQLSLTRNTVCIVFDGKEIVETTVHPSEFGLEPLEIKQDKSLTSEDSLTEGLSALRGEKNYAFENILYTAAIFAVKFQLLENTTAVATLKESLESGKALIHWEIGCSLRKK